MGWLHRGWWSLFGAPLALALHFFVVLFAAYPLAVAVGPLGLAIIAVTVLVRLALFPLAWWQAATAARARRRAAEVETELAPELKMRLALASFLPALMPALAQAPLLAAMYWVIRDSGGGHFLWIANLAAPDPFLLLPALAALTTLLLGRLNRPAQPATGAPAARGLSWIAPATVAGFAAFGPAALALYWATGNLVAAVQQLVLNRMVT